MCKPYTYEYAKSVNICLEKNAFYSPRYQFAINRQLNKLWSTSICYTNTVSTIAVKQTTMAIKTLHRIYDNLNRIFSSYKIVLLYTCIL